MRPGRTGLTLRDLALSGVLGCLCFLGKWVMAALPNIEPVSLFVMLFAAVLGWKALFPIYTYVLLEIAVYGPQIWAVCYLYVWLVLAGGAWLLRGCRQPLAWALLSGGFGLLFGALCTPVHALALGVSPLAWWISGIPFDLIHGVGNFVLALALFSPLERLLSRLYRGRPVL